MLQNKQLFSKLRTGCRLKVSDLFSERFLFQLRVYFDIYLSETSDIYRKLTIYFVAFFVLTLERIFVVYIIYVYGINFIVKSSKKRCYKILFFQAAPHIQILYFFVYNKSEISDIYMDKVYCKLAQKRGVTKKLFFSKRRPISYHVLICITEENFITNVR